MNTNLFALFSSLLVATCAACFSAEVAPTQASSPDFERMKTLVGTWQGKTDMGQGPVDLTVKYRLLAAGSVLEERVFENTPNEKVTMYYLQDGKLALTHYCMLGNRPAMTLKASTKDTLQFDFNSCCGIDPKKESHMHAMTLRFNDADTITSSCKAIIDGKEAPENPTTLKRVKAATASVR